MYLKHWALSANLYLQFLTTIITQHLLMIGRPIIQTHMFQDIGRSQSHYFQEQIKRGFVSRQGVVVTVEQNGRIAVFHQEWNKNVEYLDEYLCEMHSFKFRKCWDIQQVGDGNSIVLVMGLDKSLCVIEIELVRSKEDVDEKIIRFVNMRALKVVEEQEVFKKRFSLKIHGLLNNLFSLTLYIHKTSIKIITFQLNQGPLSIANVSKSTIICDEQQPFFPWLQKILIFGFQARRFGHYLIIYDELVFKNSFNQFISVDLNSCKELQYHIQAPRQLPQSQQDKILKDIYVVQSSKRIEEALMLLFYQHQQCLQVTQVSMSNPSVSLKHIKHPYIILYKIISCSMTPQAVELRGEEYCLEMLNFIIHAKTELNGEDKLIILPAPFAYRPDKIINQSSLPAQLLQITSSHALCCHHLFTINLTPKSTIYRNFLFELAKSEPLFRTIQQLLD